MKKSFVACHGLRSLVLGPWSLVLSGVLYHFLHRRIPVEDRPQAVVAQRAHALLDRLLADDECRRFLRDEVAERFAHAQPFVDAHAAAIAGLAADRAAAAVEKLPVAHAV